MKYIKTFEDIRLSDIPLVGGKSASLGEMINALSTKNIYIPRGFAVTTRAYWTYLEYNNYNDIMRKKLAHLNSTSSIKMIQRVGHSLRQLLYNGTMPDDLIQEITQAYHALSLYYKQSACDVAVRSSATAEDLPTASFAGQQETFLHIHGIVPLLDACKKSIASLFTDRAIVYRMGKNIDHFEVALSIGIQKMVRSDRASAGVAFSLDTESGFKDVVIIDAAYGLGEGIVQGFVTPDEFCVHKPTLQQGFKPIIKKQRGDKKIKMVYGKNGTIKRTKVPISQQNKFSLTDNEILSLARMVITIEHYYSAIGKRWMPMDIEWAKDGIDGRIYIVQARPETVHAVHENKKINRYKIRDAQKVTILVTGQSIGQHVKTGTARVIKDVSQIGIVRDNDIIVTEMTDPDWVPVLKRAAGIITDRGGRTCHAAIVSRELGIPAIVGTAHATKKIKNGQKITIDCSHGMQGSVYDGHVVFNVETVVLDKVPPLPVKLMINIGDPNSAFAAAALPVAGVGLARLEFIIATMIKVHPMALLHPKKVVDHEVRYRINEVTSAYKNKKDFFIDTLAQGIGMIAAALYPRPVIVRLSDFKSNEYRNLIGGIYFEPVEENPMLGLRGASRYYNQQFKQAFVLECTAFKKVRDEMGLKNIVIMVPFVRTPDEAEKVLQIMQAHGLKRGKDDLQIIMMCEIPSNIILIDAFSKLFDGFSIGSNDLTQLTLGVDRDSQQLASLFDERDEAVKIFLEYAIKGAHRNKRSIGICGQAPSDYPDLAQFLITRGIDSLSLNPDSVIPFLMRYKKKKVS